MRKTQEKLEAKEEKNLGQVLEEIQEKLRRKSLAKQDVKVALALESYKNLAASKKTLRKMQSLWKAEQKKTLDENVFVNPRKHEEFRLLVNSSESLVQPLVSTRSEVYPNISLPEFREKIEERMEQGSPNLLSNFSIDPKFLKKKVEINEGSDPNFINIRDSYNSSKLRSTKNRPFMFTEMTNNLTIRQETSQGQTQAFGFLDRKREFLENLTTEQFVRNTSIEFKRRNLPANESSLQNVPKPSLPTIRHGPNQQLRHESNAGRSELMSFQGE